MITVDVTQEYIDKGCRGGAGSCPVARAINAILKDSCSAYVSDNQFVLHDKVKSIASQEERPLPSIVTEFIKDFDNDYIVKPFQFELDIPEQYLKTG